MKDKKLMIGVLSAITLETLYGFSYLFIRSAVTGRSVFVVMFWRCLFGICAMTAAMLLGVFKVSVKGKPLKRLLTLSALVSIAYVIGEAYGVKLTSVSESGTLISLTPLVTLGLSALILKIKPSGFQLTGIALSVAGVLIIVLVKGFEASLSVPGYFFLVLALVSYPLYAVLSSDLTAFTSIEKTYITVMVGLVFFTFAAFAECIVKGTVKELVLLPFTNREFLVSMFYLGVCCTFIAYTLVNVSIDCLGANKATAFTGLCTVVSVISGVLILGDSFSLVQGIGTLLVIIGVLCANLPGRGPKDEPARYIEAEDIAMYH